MPPWTCWKEVEVCAATIRWFQPRNSSCVVFLCPLSGRAGTLLQSRWAGDLQIGSFGPANLVHTCEPMEKVLRPQFGHLRIMWFIGSMPFSYAQERKRKGGNWSISLSSENANALAGSIGKSSTMTGLAKKEPTGHNSPIQGPYWMKHARSTECAKM